MIPFIGLASVGEGMCKLLSAIFHAEFTEVKMLRLSLTDVGPIKAISLPFGCHILWGQYCNNILYELLKKCTHYLQTTRSGFL